MEPEAKNPEMESIDDELFQAPLTDEALEGVSGGGMEDGGDGGGTKISFCEVPSATEVGQSAAFDSIRDT